MSLLLLFNQNGQPSAQALAAAEGVRAQVLANAVDWTGVEERGNSNAEMTEKTMAAISELRILIQRTDLTNSEKSRAMAIANALDALIESPQPEWKLIVQLFSSPALNNVVSMANVLLFVFQIFGLAG